MRTLKTISISVLLLVLLGSRTSATDDIVPEVAPEIELANTEPIVVQLDDGVINSRCTFGPCYDKCGKSGLSGGYCWKDECICLGNTGFKHGVLAKDAQVNAVLPAGCNNNQCNQKCRGIRFDSGTCQQDCCVCRRRDQAPPSATCTSSTCNFITMQLFCDNLSVDKIQSIIQPYKATLKEPEVEEVEREIEAPPCERKTCRKECRESGYLGGYCRISECRCVGKKFADIQPFDEQDQIEDAE